MAISKLRYIVSRDQPQLYEYLRQEFSGDDIVDVVMDRRGQTAPQLEESSTVESGQPDRRTHDLSTSMRGVGWAIVWDQSSSPSNDPSSGRNSSGKPG